MTIFGVVVILFVLGLFFSMLGQQPRTDHEWQNDTDSDNLSTPICAEENSVESLVEEPVGMSHA